MRKWGNDDCNAYRMLMRASAATLAYATTEARVIVCFRPRCCIDQDCTVHVYMGLAHETNVNKQWLMPVTWAQELIAYILARGRVRQ
jgi:hypothetical protein